MRHFFLSFLILVLFISCKDDDDCNNDLNLNVDQTQLAADITLIDNYLAQNNIIAQEDPTGLRYVILEEGEGGSPGLCSPIYVNYTGWLIGDGQRGQQFDTSDGRVRRLSLTTVINGWRIGIPKINEGGRIRLFIPSVYAYGVEGNDRGEVEIPPNASLEFEVELVLAD